MDIALFAKSKGYEDALFEGEWNEYSVYKPILPYEHMKVGYPLRILVKNNDIRMTSVKESIEYLRSKLRYK